MLNNMDNKMHMMPNGKMMKNSEMKKKMVVKMGIKKTMDGKGGCKKKEDGKGGMMKDLSYNITSKLKSRKADDMMNSIKKSREMVKGFDEPNMKKWTNKQKIDNVYNKTKQINQDWIGQYSNEYAHGAQPPYGKEEMTLSDRLSKENQWKKKFGKK